MIIIAGLIIAFVLIVIFSNRATRQCRWREARSGDRDGQRRFRCMACGAEAFTSDGKPPLHCMAKTPRR